MSLHVIFLYIYLLMYLFSVHNFDLFQKYIFTSSFFTVFNKNMYEYSDRGKLLLHILLTFDLNLMNLTLLTWCFTLSSNLTPFPPVWLPCTSISHSQKNPTHFSFHSRPLLYISLMLLTGIKAFLQSEGQNRYLNPTGAFSQLTNPIRRHSCHSLHNSTLAPAL